MIKTLSDSGLKDNIKISNFALPKSVEYVAATNVGANATTINIPVGVLPGDMAIFMQVTDSTNVILNTPTNFTKIMKFANGQTYTDRANMCMAIAYRIMPDPVPATISGITSRSDGLCMAVFLRNTSNPPNYMFSISAGSSGSPQPTNTSSVELYDYEFKNGIVITGAFQDDDVTPTLLQSPTGYTVLLGGLVAGGTSGAGCSAGIAYKTTTTDTVTQNDGWDFDDKDTWIIFSIGVAPKSILG